MNANVNTQDKRTPAPTLANARKQERSGQPRQYGEHNLKRLPPEYQR
nr:MAG TPA: hypothetical protein [Caudoviricetes sp.]